MGTELRTISLTVLQFKCEVNQQIRSDHHQSDAVIDFSGKMPLQSQILFCN